MIFIFVNASYIHVIRINKIILRSFCVCKLGIQVFSKTCITCILQSYKFSIAIQVYIEDNETTSETSLEVCLKNTFFLQNLGVQICLKLVQICNAIFCLMSRNPLRIFFSIMQIKCHIYPFFLNGIHIHIDINNFEAL